MDDQRGLAMLQQTATHPTALSPGAMLQAQRLVGNRALAQSLTVQRGPGEGDPPAVAGANPNPGTSVDQSTPPEKQTNAGVGSSDPLDITAKKATEDYDKLIVKLADVPTLNVEGFVGPMKRYVDCAKVRDQRGRTTQ